MPEDGFDEYNSDTLPPPIGSMLFLGFCYTCGLNAGAAMGLALAILTMWAFS